MTLHSFHLQLNADDYEEDLNKIREQRGYSYSDIIECCADKLPNYEEKLKNFYQEHLHADEEIRFVLDGRGYFDVRNVHDQWVRVLVEKGDLLVLPPGIYHRFTLDTNVSAQLNTLSSFTRFLINLADLNILTQLSSPELR